MPETINNAQEFQDIEAQWNEEDPKIIEAAQKFMEEERLTEEEREKIKKVYLQHGREEEYNYETKQKFLFYQYLPSLIKDYSGLYVWFEDGEVKDSDLDEVTLCGRAIRSDEVRSKKLRAIYVNKVPELN